MICFDDLTIKNKQRCIEGFKHELDSWLTDQWTNAIAGEAGEACNIAKKLNRLDNGINGNKPEDRDYEILELKLGDELADIVIYCDLLATKLGFNLGRLVKNKFNEKSDEIGSPIKL